MQFNADWIELVPSRRDPEDFQDPLARAAYQRAQQELEVAGVPVQLDALYWVFRLAQETDQLNRISRGVPWLDRLAVGFIDPETDALEPAFGLVGYANVPRGIEIDREVFSPDRLGNLGVDAGPWFPLAIRVGARVDETAITAPSSALATCWVRNHRTGGEGWLVPYHAVDLAGPVSFDDGSTGRVTDNFGDCIDAVIVNSSSGPPSGLTPTRSVRGLSASTPVEVLDQRGVGHSATIVDVDINLGIVTHNLFPIRFSYDWSTSAPGDSGALITAEPCGEPVGMHQGAFDGTDRRGNPSKIAYGLCLYQLEDYGGLEVQQ